MLEGRGDLFPRVLAYAPEAHVSLFQSHILKLTGITDNLRRALTQYLTRAGLQPGCDAPETELPGSTTLEFTTMDDVALIELSGDADRAALPALRIAIETACTQGRLGVVVGLSRVTVLAPSVLALLRDLQLDAHEQGCRLAVSATGPVRQLMSAMGYAGVFTLFSSSESARTEFAATST